MKSPDLKAARSALDAGDTCSDDLLAVISHFGVLTELLAVAERWAVARCSCDASIDMPRGKEVWVHDRDCEVGPLHAEMVAAIAAVHAVEPL